MENCIAMLETIKIILKNKKIRYSSLAKKLEMSEIGVKKMLNSKDISIVKLSKICQILDISITELLSLNSKPHFVEQDFSDEMYELFESDINFLKIFFLLSIEKKTVKEIEEKYQLTKKSIQYYLKGLENVKILQFIDANSVKLDLDGNYWSKPHPLKSKFKDNCVKNLIDQIRASKNKSKTYFPFYCLKISENSRKELEIDLESLAKKYWIQSRNDSYIYKKEQLGVFSFSIQLAPLSFVNSIDNIG